MVVSRVLIVEDSWMLRAIVAELVALHGLAPVEAETAEDALALALADPPGVMLLDEQLSDATGAEVIRRLQAANDPRVRAIPVVGLVGRASIGTDRFAGGAKCVVRKPVDPAELMRAVRWALDVYGPPGAEEP